jgi:hypothetical protein
MLDEHMLRRLAFVRYMHGLAVDQSRQPEPQCAVALLTFQDSIELFFQLACEHLDVKTDRNTRFDQYWGLLDPNLQDAKLTQAPAVSRLNKARVALKHYGTLPAVADLESYRATSLAFFQENTPRVFGLEFDSISLVDMVECETARAQLREAQEALQRGDRGNALNSIALAFAQMLADHETKFQDRFGNSPFGFDDGGALLRGFALETEDRELRRYLARLGEAVRVLALGIDYRRYVTFRRLTPHVAWTMGGHVLHQWSRDEPPSQAECAACIDFVVDCAVRVQQLDRECERVPRPG